MIHILIIISGAIIGWYLCKWFYSVSKYNQILSILRDIISEDLTIEEATEEITKIEE